MRTLTAALTLLALAACGPPAPPAPPGQPSASLGAPAQAAPAPAAPAATRVEAPTPAAAPASVTPAPTPESTPEPTPEAPEPAPGAPLVAPETAARPGDVVPAHAMAILAAMRTGRAGPMAEFMKGPVRVTYRHAVRAASEQPPVRVLKNARAVDAWLTKMYPCFRPDAAEAATDTVFCDAFNGVEQPEMVACDGLCCRFYETEDPPIVHQTLYLLSMCFAPGGRSLRSLELLRRGLTARGVAAAAPVGTCLL